MKEANREQIARVIREEILEKLSIRIKQHTISYSPSIAYIVELVYEGEVISEDSVYIE